MIQFPHAYGSHGGRPRGLSACSTSPTHIQRLQPELSHTLSSTTLATLTLVTGSTFQRYVIALYYAKALAWLKYNIEGR